MSYYNYEFALDKVITSQAKKIIAREMGIPITKVSMGIRSDKLKQALKQISDSSQNILSEEYHWQTGPRHIIFPKNNQLLEMLANSKITMDHMDAFEPPHEQFILAIPKNCDLLPIDARGAMVTYVKSKELMVDIIRKIAHNYGNGEINEDKIGFTEPKLIITICTKAREDKSANLYNRVLISIGEIPEILKMTGEELYEKRMKDYAGKKEFEKIRLSPRELMIHQFTLTKVIVSLCVYTMFARSNDRMDILQEGLPGKFKVNDLKTPIMKSANHQTIALHSQIRRGNSQKAHYRSYHFRQLTHSKFYQNEYKDMKVGSRIVFVSDSFVKAKVKAETLLV